MSLFREHPELLAGFREGRPAVLDRIYRAYSVSVERNLRAMARAYGIPELAQASAVADLLQEVFVRAFSKTARRSYDGLREFGSYLSTIVRNCFIDALRNQSREVLREPEELRIEIERHAVVPDDSALDPKVAGVLAAYIRGLPSPLAGIYEQRFVLGTSQEEASSALGLSRRVIRTGEKKLRSGLRKALIQSGIRPGEMGAGAPLHRRAAPGA